MNVSKKGQFSLFPPPELTEYFILISPPVEVKNETKKLKKKLYKTTGTTTENQYNVAHIPLFKTKWEKDKHVLERLIKGLENQKSFPIAINGAGVFDHGSKKKTLYLKIENPKPIQALFDTIAGEFKFRNEITPHLTIEQNISVADFEKIQNDLSSFDYQNEWICDRITVLKKDKNKGTYKIVEELMLAAQS